MSRAQDCRVCGTRFFTKRKNNGHYCAPCGAGMRQIHRNARNSVSMAVAAGKLPNPKTLKCVDCQEKAIEYDHRDYGNLRKVEPVCRRCNIIRGPADAYGRPGERLKARSLEWHRMQSQQR